MIEGVDYAWHNNADLGALVTAGKHFAMRYVSHDPQVPSKNLTVAEKNTLFNNGVAVGLVFEDAAQRALAGYAAGQQDAAFVVQQTTNLGLPDIPVFFAVDFDVTDKQKPTVAKYLSGVASNLGESRTGVYCDYYLIKYLVENATPVAWFWQTYAWSGGQIHPSAHLLQYHNSVTIGGIDCDLDRTLVDDISYLRPLGAPRKPATVLKAETGYWAWVQWRLGEGDWKGWGSANPAVRPNVPTLISGAWWDALVAFLKARGL